MSETSCDKRGHIMSPVSPRCVVCGVFSSQMMLVTREVYEQTRQRLAAAEALASYEVAVQWRNKCWAHEERIAGLEERLAAAEAENERLTRWRNLAVAAATAGAEQEVFKRFAESEAIQPIIKAWKDKVNDLTARLAAAEDRIIALRDAIKPFAEFAKLLDDFDDEHSVIRRKDWLVSDHRKAAAAYGDD